MPDLTKNYGLKKPLANEYAKPDDFNENADKVDELLKKLDDEKMNTSDADTKTAAALKEHNESVTAHDGALAPAYTYGTDDLEAGVTELETGKVHFVYE